MSLEAVAFVPSFGNATPAMTQMPLPAKSAASSEPNPFAAMTITSAKTFVPTVLG